MPGPAKTFKDGGVTVTIWENNGPRGPWMSASICKSYKDKASGEWKQTANGFSDDQLEKLRKLIPKAQAFMTQDVAESPEVTEDLPF